MVQSFVAATRESARTLPDFPDGDDLSEGWVRLGFTINVEALIGRAKEFIAREIGGALDGIIGWCTRDLHGMLMGVRATAKDAKALTMEVYLGLLPALFARMFRNIFFPVWDLLLHQGMKALSDAIGFDNDEALRMIRMARRQVQLVVHPQHAGASSLGHGVRTSTHARQQLAGAERLGEVVVCAHFQTEYAIGLLIFGGQH